MSVAFLKGYFDTLGRSPLLPATDAELQALLDIYLLDRTMDELGNHLVAEPALIRPACEAFWNCCNHNRSAERFIRMMSTEGSNGFLDAPGNSLSELISAALERLFGPAVRAPAAGALSWEDLVAAFCLVLLVLLMNGLAAWFLRSTLRRAESNRRRRLAGATLSRLRQAALPADLALRHLSGCLASGLKCFFRGRIQSGPPASGYAF